MNYTRIFIVLCFFIATKIYTQDSIKPFPRYIRFLRHPSPASQNHLITASYQYMLSPVGTTLGAQGTIANIGLNIARFFSRKFVLGISYDLKYIPGISTKNPGRQFVRDFNDAFITSYSTPLDSANAYVVRYALNDNGSHITGNNVFNLGVIFSPFPQKYGGLLFQVKYGVNGYNIHGRIYENKFIEGGGRDFYSISVSKNWTYELSFKPAAFFGNTFLNTEDYEPSEIWEGFIISFYYQRLNFATAEFNGTPFSKMTSDEFNKKYALDNRFGIKLGMSFY